MTSDATQREQLEQALRRSLAELAEVQRLAQVGSWEWEMEPDLLHWSDEMHRIHGSEPGTPVTYRSLLERLHPDDRAAAEAIVEATLQNGDAFEFEQRIRRPDGADRVIQARGRVVRDPDGKPLRLFGTAQDITERREFEARALAFVREQTARESAQAAETRFRFLAEAGHILASSLAIEETLRSVTRLAIPRIADWCSLDLVQPNGELRRVEVAHADPARVRIAHEIDRRFPPGANTRAADPAAASLRRGEPLLIEDFSEAVLAAAAPDPEHRELLRRLGFRSAMCVPLVARERLVGLITLATAESERRFGADDLSLVESLASRAALAIDNARLFEQATAVATAREDAVATVSHDLRSPLTVMSTNLVLLRDAGAPEDERALALDRMTRSVASMERMIGDLLDVTRLEAGAVALRRESREACDLLGEACEREQPVARGRSVRIDVEAEPGLRVFADADRVVQVIANLLNNAVRHSPAGGRVHVSARATADGALIAVTDEGTGVPRELGDRIFQRFWQNESRLHRGTAGLGLAIARALVELHDGRIWVEAAEPCGARFCFTLAGVGKGGS